MVDQRQLSARIDALRWQMLGTQKTLGATTEGGDVRPWPEVFSEIAAIQQELAAVMTEVKVAEQQRLGQTLIDACFPKRAHPTSMYSDGDLVFGAACHNATILSIQIIYKTDGDLAVIIRCRLDPQADRQVLLDADIRSSTIDMYFDRCQAVKFDRTPEHTYWDGQRIASWESDRSTHDDQSGFSALQRIRGTDSTLLELNYWDLVVTEVLD